MKRTLIGMLLVGFLGGALALVRPIEAQTPSAGGAFLPNTILRIAGVWLNDKLLWSNIRPTIVSGFGTSPSISSNNGNATFRINVGTGGSASSGVVGLVTSPTAATGWNCHANSTSAPAGLAFVTKQTGTTATSVTFTGYRDDGEVAAWTSGVTLIVTCAAY